MMAALSPSSAPGAARAATALQKARGRNSFLNAAYVGIFAHQGKTVRP